VFDLGRLLVVCGLVWAFIVARVVGRALVVGTRRVIGLGGVVVFADKTAKMASTNQFFDFILECFTFLCGMVGVSVVVAVFSHVHVGGSGRLAWRWDEVGL